MTEEQALDQYATELEPRDMRLDWVGATEHLAELEKIAAAMLLDQCATESEPRDLGLDRMNALLDELEKIAATLHEQMKGVEG